MKIPYAAMVASLVVLVGCAKNSDMAALRSEIATLKESVSAAKNDAQERSDSLQTKCDELEQEVAKLKASNSELADDIHYQAVAAVAAEKEISKLGIQLTELKMSVDETGSLVDTKADAMEALKLEERVKICEEGASSIRKQLDDLELHAKLQDMGTKDKFEQVKKIFQARDATERMADLAFFWP